MDRPADGFAFLKELRERNGKERQSFFQYTRFLQTKAREKGIPIHGQFELTPLCNFDCGMCYVHLDPGQLRGRSVLPPDVWKGLMRQAWEAGMLHAVLTGGECLTYPGFDELYLYLQGLGCRTMVLTNGFLLDDARIRFFREHMPDRIQITLYGWNDDVYERVTGRRAFGTVSGNARRAIDAGLRVGISVTPTAILGEDVLETIRAARRITPAVTVNDSIFSPRQETGRADRKDDPETDLYLRIYRLLDELDGREPARIDADTLPPPGGPHRVCETTGLRCGGGRSSFALNWDGTMTACNRMEMIRADALKDGFLAAWRQVNRQACEWPRVPECEGCPYDGVCGNCAAEMLRFAKAGEQPLALCRRTMCLVAHGVKKLGDETC